MRPKFPQKQLLIYMKLNLDSRFKVRIGRNNRLDSNCLLRRKELYTSIHLTSQYIPIMKQLIADVYMEMLRKYYWKSIH